MSVTRSLRFSCPPSESITLEDLKIFLHEATILEFKDWVEPRVTIPSNGGSAEVGMIRSIMIEDVFD